MSQSTALHSCRQIHVQLAVKRIYQLDIVAGSDDLSAGQWPVSSLLLAEAGMSNPMLSHIYLSPAPCHPKGLLSEHGLPLV